MLYTLLLLLFYCKVKYTSITLLYITISYYPAFDLYDISLFFIAVAFHRLPSSLCLLHSSHSPYLTFSTSLTAFRTNPFLPFPATEDNYPKMEEGEGET